MQACASIEAAIDFGEDAMIEMQIIDEIYKKVCGVTFVYKMIGSCFENRH